MNPDTSGRWVTIKGRHVFVGGKGGLEKHSKPNNIVPAGHKEFPLYKHQFVPTRRGSVLRTRPMTARERKRWLR